MATIPTSDQAARVSVTNARVGHVMGIPISEPVFGDVMNLPEPRRGTLYIVSMTTVDALPQRRDLVGVNETLRDDAGRVILGAQSLTFPNGRPEWLEYDEQMREAQRQRVNALLDRTA